MSPEAGRGNCFPYVQRLRRFPASQENKYRDEINKNKMKRMNNLTIPYIFSNIFGWNKQDSLADLLSCRPPHSS